MNATATRTKRKSTVRAAKTSGAADFAEERKAAHAARKQDQADAFAVERATRAKKLLGLPAGHPDRDALGVAGEVFETLTSKARSLETTLADVDSMANSAFDRIASIVKLTLNYLKSPTTVDRTCVLANALEEIWRAAEEAQRYQDCEVRDAGLVPDNDTRNLEYLRARAA